MLRSTKVETITFTNVITTSNSDVINVDRAERFSIQAVIDVNTPAAKSFAEADVNVTDNTITETAHGYVTGLKGQFTTTTLLPSGLSLATDYFVIKVDADTYKVATSLVNALAGTAVDMTDDGTGTHTFTPTSIAGATVTLQKSNDNSNFDAVAAGTSISADGNVWFEISNPSYKYARLSYTLTAGMLSANNYLVIKEVV